MSDIPSRKTTALPLWRTAWPLIGPMDSDSLRRRKLSVRAGHLAMAFLIVAAAAGTPSVAPSLYGWPTLIVLALASIAYSCWNVVGSTGIVALVLWDGAQAPPLSMRRPRCGRMIFFIIQISLAVFIYWFSERGRIPNLNWLLLLPPVAYAVFILEWRGIAVIATLMFAVLALNMRAWHGLAFAAYAGLAFSFAILFTLVFSVLAVQSEKARNEVQRLAAELAEANRRLREYAVQAEELSATRERNRIAREIHDSLGHFLTVANVQIEAARALDATDPAQAREAVGKAQTLIQEGLRDIRRSVASLRASPLDNKSLVQALRELAPDLAVVGPPRPLPPAAELSLYRAAQEGLTNARKHARAHVIQVCLNFQSAQSVTLAVQDDGVGAALPADAGFGLRGLRERAQLLNGSLKIRTAPNAGFRLEFEVPA